MNIRQSELRVLEVLWNKEEVTARELYRILEDTIDWKKSTTYTVLKKCREKGFVERIEPDYICKATITLKEIREAKIMDLVHLFFADSMECFKETLEAMENESESTEDDKDESEDENKDVDENKNEDENKGDD